MNYSLKRYTVKFHMGCNSFCPGEASPPQSLPTYSKFVGGVGVGKSRVLYVLVGKL